MSTELIEYQQWIVRGLKQQLVDIEKELAMRMSLIEELQQEENKK